MKNYNLLLLSSSNHVQLVNSFKKAFEKLELKADIYTADLQEHCASGFVSKKHFSIPRSDSDEYFLVLERIIKENNINIILSARDEELSILSANKEFFERLDCYLLISKAESIKLCRDKYKLNIFFAKNNIPHPKTFLIKDLKNSKTVNYPIICKPRIGKGGMGILLAQNFTVIENQIINYENYIFQEYIKGIEYTIDVLNNFEGKVLSIIPRKRTLVKGGESIISITEKNDRLMKYAKLICEKIGFIGHINIQCIMKNDSPYFIEINPRFGGASNAAFKAGMNSPLIIMKMLLGEKIEPFIGNFKDNLMMLRYSQDFFIERDE